MSTGKSVKKIVPFTYEGCDVRTVEIEGEPWFVAKDICSALGIANSSDALIRLDGDEKNTIGLTDGNRGNPNTLIISESGMYALVLSSRKPEAKPFRKRVTSEVLPQIRKTGSYSLTSAPALPGTFVEALKLLVASEEQKAIVEAERDAAIKTKAQIGSKREATAMATASIKSRECKKLEDRLGEGENYKQAKAIPWLKDYFHLTKGAYSMIGRTLAKISKEAGCESIKIPHTKYGSVKGYHADAISVFKDRLDFDPELLEKYRLQ